MAIFTEGSYKPALDIDMDFYNRMMLEMTILGMDDAALAEFCAPGGVGEQMVLEAHYPKSSIVRLSKEASIKKRQAVMAFAMAKQKNDPAFVKWFNFRQKAKAQEEIIMDKYFNRLKNAAALAEKEHQQNKKSAAVASASGAAAVSTPKDKNAGEATRKPSMFGAAVSKLR